MTKKQTNPLDANRPRRSAIDQPAMHQPAYNTYRARRLAREEDAQRITPQQQIKLRQASMGLVAALRRNWRRVGLLVILTALVALNIRVSSRPNIVKSGIWPTSALHSQAEYSNALHQLLSSPINSNKLTINANNIENTIKQQFPELSSVAITLPIFGNTPTVYLQPYQPKFVLVTQANRLFVIDSTGRVIADGNDSNTFNSNQNIPVVNDRTGVDLQIGNKALPQSSVDVLDEVYAQLTAKGLVISSIDLTPGGGDALFRLESEKYYIRFSLLEQGREQAGAYLAARENLRINGKMPVEYVDARVANKVYYK